MMIGPTPPCLKHLEDWGQNPFTNWDEGPSCFGSATILARQIVKNLEALLDGHFSPVTSGPKAETGSIALPSTIRSRH